MPIGKCTQQMKGSDRSENTLTLWMHTGIKFQNSYKGLWCPNVNVRRRCAAEEMLSLLMWLYAFAFIYEFELHGSFVRSGRMNIDDVWEWGFITFHFFSLLLNSYTHIFLRLFVSCAPFHAHTHIRLIPVEHFAATIFSRHGSLRRRSIQNYIYSEIQVCRL